MLNTDAHDTKNDNSVNTWPKNRSNKSLRLEVN